MVNAGADSILLTSQMATLKGLVTDDGILAPLTTTWSQVSGPGVTTFASQAADTTATFSQKGTYVLRLSAYDGVSTVTDDVSVAVALGHTRPTVNAGAEVSVTGRTYKTPGGFVVGEKYEVICTTTLGGSASDDKLP
jgi:hypothetical protein